LTEQLDRIVTAKQNLRKASEMHGQTSEKMQKTALTLQLNA